MTQINPYLSFKNTCEEAFNLYKSVFGGEFQMVARMTDIDMGMPIPEGSENLIMHISYPIGGNILMGSDCPEGWGPKLEVGNNYSVSVTVDSKEEADRVHKGLSEGGTVTMPMDNAPWGSYFGMITDKFGVNWMISFDQRSEA
jgi:PhnB protein